MRFELHGFPADPPPTSSAQGFNRVQVELKAWGVQQILIDGMTTSPVVDLSVVRDGSLIRVLDARVQQAREEWERAGLPLVHEFKNGMTGRSPLLRALRELAQDAARQLEAVRIKHRGSSPRAVVEAARPGSVVFQASTSRPVKSVKSRAASETIPL